MTLKNPLKIHWLILGFFAVVILLEYTTPADYVFGYLYTVPILLAHPRLNRMITLQVTVSACLLTLLNLVFPLAEINNSATVANRIIVVFALIVTGWLSDRTRRYEEAISQQQAQLQAHQKLASVREDFASTLTHDLKTPLLGAIEMLKSFQNRQFGDINSTQEKILDMMLRSHQSSLQLVQTLLDVYRNDTEGLKLNLEPINLVEIAEEAIATLTNLAETRRIYFNLSYQDSNFRRYLWVKGDQLQLQRVFSNLLINGINHSPRGGRVEVILESEAHFQVVKIWDQGLGITPEELPNLFERFYQGNSDRQAKGSGLGLYLTRQIIEAHGGIIWAENKIPNGAMFCFRLPALAQG
ncbi:Sensor histidine kinase ResE [Planktothrix tepida]|uniref:histidine kinase n=2 Tax=Planktothrix TaxID=54304 RepID=A0A1J1LF17_9CYAN|nr:MULTISPECIES: HAMP domain-containing sensor histidine kinase [Planktothrix]CAD5922187.1 Sensor histidine kinase ResE [Planktothrix tepida]CAD5982675.1 Sensor histidine kinase ResE [Planktothrix pseudagardhii]CUR31024.1 ATPase, histidine kinase-, DNA gyrase B-, and HSP90-like domain protein [Planktothrix tepida PCC 9214]